MDLDITRSGLADSGGPKRESGNIGKWQQYGSNRDRTEPNVIGNSLEAKVYRLALIIVLDQFSRSVYKGTPLAYAQDPAALQLALSGTEVGMERDLSLMERLFFTLPMGHAEGSDLAERGDWMVRQAEEMVELAPPHLRLTYEHSLSQAKAHREVIARFGRYPHRNEVLGRTSTPDELQYLRTETPVHLRRPPQQ